VIGALWMLGLLGACSVVNSEMPRAYAWPLAMLALGYGGWLAIRESRRSSCALVWPATGQVTLDGLAIDDASLHWRGPLAFLSWRDAKGRVRRLNWWPDMLAAGMRRELRLAAIAQAPVRPHRSMAP
jgi:toxin CptA